MNFIWFRNSRSKFMISCFAKTETFPDQIRLGQKQAGKWKNKRRWNVGYLVLTSYKLEKGKFTSLWVKNLKYHPICPLPH